MAEKPNLLWDDDNGFVCACCKDTSKEEFIEQVKIEAATLEIELPEELEVNRQAMIYAEHTIHADMIFPMSGLGVIIEDCWVLGLG